MPVVWNYQQYSRSIFWYNYFIIFLIVLFALRVVNIPLTLFTFLGGAVAIGVGFGAQNLINNGVILVSEGANMPTEPDGVDIFLQEKLLYGPGKAANAGGVAVSGLEMSQNSLRLSWTREEVDQRLQQIMKDIHQTCVDFGTNEDGSIDYIKGANIGGFVKVADAMLAQGVV